MSDYTNSDKPLLYIEDNDLSRKTQMKNFTNHNINNIIAPTSKEECQKILKEKSFIGAIIDYRLTDWLGINYEHAIHLGEKERHNGYELAHYLNEIYPGIQIGIYTANESDLNFKFDANYCANIELVSHKNLPLKDVNKVLTQYALNRLYNLEVRATPIFDATTELPLFAKTYIARRITQPLNRGKYLWKSGQYAWQVTIAPPIEEPTEPGNSEVYQLTVDPNTTETIRVKSLNSGIVFSKDKDELLEVLNQGNLNAAESFIAAEYICRLYLEHTIDENDTISLLHNLNNVALFTQKYLFINVQKDKYNHFFTKEQVQHFLSPFTNAGFPKIIEVFEGTVENIDEDEAHIHLKSYAPSRKVTHELFDKKILERVGLEENATFEFTVFETDINSGSYHIEPTQV